MKSINLLVAGALIISFSPIFVKLIELGPTWIAFWRATIAASFLFLFQFKLPNRANYKSFFKLSFLAGLTIALDLFVWHKSIKMIGAGLATVLGNTQVIYMVVFSIWIFKEPLTKKKTSSLLLAILGVLLISNIEIPSEVSSDQFYLGVVYGLLTGVAYATFMILLRKLESEITELSTLQKLFWVYFFCSIVLFLLSFIDREIQVPHFSDWPWILALGLVVNIGGWKLITSNLPRVSTATAGLVLLIQPAGATLWGVLIFKESFGSQQLLGMVLLFLGIYISSLKTKVKREVDKVFP